MIRTNSVPDDITPVIDVINSVGWKVILKWGFQVQVSQSFRLCCSHVAQYSLTIKCQKC